MLYSDIFSIERAWPAPSWRGIEQAMAARQEILAGSLSPATIRAPGKAPGMRRPAPSAVDWVLRDEPPEAADPLEETISLLADRLQRDEVDAKDAVLAGTSPAARLVPPLLVGEGRNSGPRG
jgi:hypothetical protein